MRIIDAKRDYYDCIQAQGQDQSLLYIRNRETVDLSKVGFPFPRFMGGLYTRLSIRTHVIGFCGNVYLAIQIGGRFGETTSVRRSEEPERDTICFNLAEVDSFMESHLKPRQVAGYYAGRSAHGRDFDWPYSCRKYEFEKLFDLYAKDKGNYKNWFEVKRCPVFAATFENSHDATITYNALLREYEFFRVFDPPHAFQEIMMYMSNMAMPEKPIPELSNDDMAHSKGHGDRYSFRTAPGTKPGRKNK